jgi:hypothetical protein
MEHRNRGRARRRIVEEFTMRSRRVLARNARQAHAHA